MRTSPDAGSLPAGSTNKKNTRKFENSPEKQNVPDL